MSGKQLTPQAMRFAKAISTFDPDTISQLRRLVDTLLEEQTQPAHPATEKLKAVGSREDFLRLLKEYAPH